MLVAEPGEAPALLDFFVAAPGRRRRPVGARAARPGRGVLRGRRPGLPRRRGVVRGLRDAGGDLRGAPPLRHAPARRPRRARRRARACGRGAQRAAGLHLRPARADHRAARRRRARSTGSAIAWRARATCSPTPSSPTRSSGSARRGRRRSTPVTSRARRASGWRAGGGTLTEADLAGYEAIAREPIRVGYRGYDVFTNPPPSAGGILIASVLAQLDREPAPPTQARLVAAMEEAHQARTPEFMEGLDRPGFLEEFMASQLGSTTHISVLDGDGRACAVTCTNGEGSGIDRARHRRPPQQHDGRGGPLAAGVLHPPGRAAAAVDDGPDRGRARRRGRTSRSAPRAPTASAPRSCR